MKYRGVEQLEARRAHNPEVVGSSPASATKIIPDFDKKSGIFLTFVIILPRSQINWLYVNSWGRDKTQIIGSCRSKSPRHDFYVWQNRILFLKFEKFRIPKQTLFRTFVLLLQPSMKPFDQGTSMEFRISWNQL